MAVPAPDLAALRVLGDRVRPLALAGERTLPVPDALASLLPQGGLQRGSLVATRGAAATSLALALTGPVTTGGAWVAVVGLADLGVVAAAELGVDLGRLLLVDDPGSRRWATVVEALVDAVDVVLVRPPAPVAPGIQRRLAARARDRGSVLLQVGGTPGAWAEAPDVVVAAGPSGWVGLGAGHGHLQARRVAVTVTGRRAAHRARTATLWLPGPGGGVARAGEEADVPDRLDRTVPGVGGPGVEDAGDERVGTGQGVEAGRGPGAEPRVGNDPRAGGVRRVGAGARVGDDRPGDLSEAG